MASLQNSLISPSMSLRRADVPDGTVAVVMVVPSDERTRPVARLIEIGEALRRELRPVLGGAEQRLHKCVIGADAQAAGVGGLQRRAHRPPRECLIFFMFEAGLLISS